MGKLYHLTSKRLVPFILTRGLLPGIGTNSQQVHEPEALVYLTDWNSIPYWSILLGKTAILEVNTEDLELETVNYSLYKEYLSSKAIDVKRIRLLAEEAVYNAEHMEQLCLQYVSMLSMCTTMCADYYTRKEWSGITEEALESCLDVTLGVLPRLDYKSIPRRKLRAELQYWGDECDTTIVDTYFDTGRRMYQQLRYYPEDKLSKKRVILSELIENAFEGCLDVNTGGYCW